MSSSAELTGTPTAGQAKWLKFVCALGLLWLADIMFYNQPIGLCVVLFAIALFAGCVLVNCDKIDSRRWIVAAGIFVAGLAPGLEGLDMLSFAILVLTTISAVAVLTDPSAAGLRVPLTAARQLLLAGPFRLIADTIAILQTNVLTRFLLAWSIPLALYAIFIFLFAAANPVIEQWLNRFRPDHVVSDVSVARVVFWLIALSLIWPFMHLRWRQHKPGPAAPDAVAQDVRSPLDSVLGPQVILRSLLMFNVLFALQTVLDGLYLWGHLALPDGMSYAAYAHRGAYPLIATALLAAAFVVVAIRPQAADQSRLVRPLVYLWVGQNVMLVMSSIQRVHLYIETYLLTGWRIAALIWMALVAVGLILIVIRIAQDRPTRWLIRVNLVVLAATLYGCSLVNFDKFIADYNVAHSREAGRGGVALDHSYLARLGPQALPAIRRAMLLSPQAPELARIHGVLLADQARDRASWRTWSFRGWRLQRDLDTHAATQTPS